MDKSAKGSTDTSHVVCPFEFSLDGSKTRMLFLQFKADFDDKPCPLFTFARCTSIVNPIVECKGQREILFRWDSIEGETSCSSPKDEDIVQPTGYYRLTETRPNAALLPLHLANVFAPKLHGCAPKASILNFSYIGPGVCTTGLISWTQGQFTRETCISFCKADPMCGSVSVVTSDRNTTSECSKYLGRCELYSEKGWTKFESYSAVREPVHTPDLNFTIVGRGYCESKPASELNGDFNASQCFSLCAKATRCKAVSVLPASKYQVGRCALYDDACTTLNRVSKWAGSHVSYQNNRFALGVGSSFLFRGSSLCEGSAINRTEGFIDVNACAQRCREYGEFGDCKSFAINSLHPPHARKCVLYGNICAYRLPMRRDRFPYISYTDARFHQQNVLDFSFQGYGICEAGRMQKWLGNYDVESCVKLCHKGTPHCKAVSVLPGKECLLYGLPCQSRRRESQNTHLSYSSDRLAWPPKVLGFGFVGIGRCSQENSAYAQSEEGDFGLEDCARKCATEPACKAFSMHPNMQPLRNGYCYLYSNPCSLREVQNGWDRTLVTYVDIGANYSTREPVLEFIGFGHCVKGLRGHYRYHQVTIEECAARCSSNIFCGFIAYKQNRCYWYDKNSGCTNETLSKGDLDIRFYRTQYLSQPTRPTATAITGLDVSLEWDYPSKSGEFDLDHYELEVARASDGLSKLLTAKESERVVSLDKYFVSTTETAFSVRVRAKTRPMFRNSVNDTRSFSTDWSEQLDFSTCSLNMQRSEELNRCTIMKPSNLTVQRVGSHDFSISWVKPEGFGWDDCAEKYSYTVRIRSRSLNFQEELHEESAQAQISLVRLFPGKTVLPSSKYMVDVRAKMNTLLNRTSHWSDAVEILTCPEYMEREDSNNAEDCKSISGFYKRATGAAESCTILERSLARRALDRNDCAPGTQIETIVLGSGFWRSSLYSENILQCPTATFCTPGGRNVSTLDGPDRYCAKHHMGTYCEDCEQGYVIGPQGCEHCADDELHSSTGVLAIVGAFATVWLVLLCYVLIKTGCLHHCRKCRCRSGGGREQKTSRMKSVCVCSVSKVKTVVQNCVRMYSSCSQFMDQYAYTKLRILTGYFQVLLAYRRSFHRHLAPSNSQLLGFLMLGSNFDVVGGFFLFNREYRCSLDSTHYVVLLAMTAGPLAVIGLLFLSAKVVVYCFFLKKSKTESTRLWHKVYARAFAVVLFGLFVIYTFVSQTVISTLLCEDFPLADRAFNLTKRALRADYRLSCEASVDSQRDFFEVYAGIMIMIYPVGVVALYCWILYKNWTRRTIVTRTLKNRARVEEAVDNAVDDKISVTSTAEEYGEAIDFLVKPYKENLFWFEAYELVRKLLQASLPGILQNSPDLSRKPEIVALHSQNLTICFLVLLLLLQPYKHNTDFYFALTSLLLLLPATQYVLADPQVRSIEWDSNRGLEALVAAELLVFCSFIIAAALLVHKRGSKKNLQPSYTPEDADTGKDALREESVRIPRELEEKQESKNADTHALAMS